LVSRYASRSTESVTVLNPGWLFFAVVFSIETSQYRRFMESTPHGFVLRPAYFTGCALIAFSYVELILKRAGFASERMAYAFEKGDREQEIHKAFSEYEKSNPDMKDRSIDCVYFQIFAGALVERIRARKINGGLSGCDFLEKNKNMDMSLLLSAAS
jgi:hypothetical protein